MANKIDVKQLNAFVSTKPVVLGVVVLIFLLAIIGSVIIVKYQRALQQGSELVRAERLIVSHIAHLQHEHHLLVDLVHATEDTAAARVDGVIEQQRERIDQLLQDLQIGYTTMGLQPTTFEQLQQYKNSWAAAQHSLDSWRSSDPDQRPATTLLTQLTTGEAILYDLLIQSERDFAEHGDNLSMLLKRLNQLLSATGALFAVTALLTIRGFGQLVTQRRQAFAALSASDCRHRALLETIPDVVLRRKRDGIYTDFKPAKAFGRFMPSSEFIGKHVNDILPPAIAQLSIDASERAWETGLEQSYEYQMNHRQTGLLRDYEARVVPSGTDEVQVIVRDITEEKQQKARLHQAQKLESLGVLAGGIAHDFNNLLTGMLAQNSLAKAKLSHGLPALEHVEKAITSAERAADLTRQLLAYAGRGTFQIVVLDLNNLIRENTGLIETALPNRAALQLQLMDQLPPVEADRGQIQQVVMNLVINAAEALGAEGGYVRITTQCRTINTAADFVDYMAERLLPGPYIALEVIDNGAGMDEATSKRIFDPFFSTKVRGHGLGLAATLGIIRAHHGGIRVESKPGIGTHFTVLFPVAVTCALPLTPKEAVVTPTYDTKLHVLVIDDEPSIREVIADILTAEGIGVLVAAGGEEGIATYRQQPQQIGLVLLDMKMPGMSGEETFRRLRALDPTVQVILSSGYTEAEIQPYFQASDIVTFLQKPYDITRLLQCVRTALASRHSAAPDNTERGNTGITP